MLRFTMNREELFHLRMRVCAVNGVTFHRIFRLVDPFVKVHILIIKLDRFTPLPAPFFPFQSSSFCCCFTSTCAQKYDNIFRLRGEKEENLLSASA